MTAFVYRQFDRAGLDAQYNNRAKVPHFETLLARRAADGEQARRMPSARLNLAYGPGPQDLLNLFPVTGTAPVPVLVFIHGGYWMAQTKEATDGVALGLVPNGVAVVNIDYSLMPAVRMDDVVRQCRAAVAWTMTHAASFGGDPARVWVAGHSAGGHLTTAVAATDWAAQPGVTAGLAPAGGFAFSGLHDLEPIRLCYLNDTLAMDEAEARRNSPVLLKPPATGDWNLLVGGIEGPEYLRQSTDLAAAWCSDAHRRVRVEVMSGDDHFSIVAPLADPGSALVRRIVSTMKG